MQRTLSTAAGAVALTLSASSCGLFGGGGEPEEPGGSGSGGTPEDGFVREGYVGTWGAYQNVRMEVTELASIDGMTRLTVEYTGLGDEPIQEMGAYDNPMHIQSFFRVLDPVNQLRYAPFPDIGADIGDFYEEELWKPGVTYEMVAFLPPLEGDPDRVTVEGPGGIGEFAGVPVTDGEPRDDPAGLPEERAEGWPEEGETVTVPVDGGESEEEPLVSSLVSTTESVVGGRETDSDQETVALRADVLFEFDEAELTDDAEGILADVVAETRERADPEKPPITITGHTDGVGDDDYNQTLSEERADAVREVLEAELGADYEYESEGAGSSEPAEPEGGDDDSWARSQNRRVDISYAFKEEVQTETEEDAELETETLSVDPADAGPPAEFRTAEGAEPAGTAAMEQDYFYGGDLQHTWDLEVYPFYRDGAFIVGRFAATHEGDPVPTTVNPFGTYESFTFSAVDPATGTIYPQVYDSADGEDLNHIERAGSRIWPSATEPGSTQYGYVYFPAPPADTTELTFNADEFGTIEGVPIEE